MEYTIPKGVFDILPYEQKEEDRWKTSDKWQHVEREIHKCASDYGYQEIRTPIFERTELFVRGVGESSDIVTKEMYTFVDKGERSMTLRPEGTASVMRAFAEKHLEKTPGLHKYYYVGPMFRYERPQSGRYRQHHQFGVEAIGIGKPEQDVEVIDLLCELYRRLGIQNLKVMINSVGDEATRMPYKKALSEYLRPYFNELSAESQVRFEKNVLRILDSKSEKDQQLLEHAPSILDFLSEEAQAHFERVQFLLKAEKIPFVVNAKLVRGLDYYNKTVFEVASSNLGAQNTIGAGGRYDGLIGMLGGVDLPSVGFATGIERILQTMVGQNCPTPTPNRPLIFLIPMGEKASLLCFNLMCRLRHLGFPIEMDLSGKKIQYGLQTANELQARFSIVLGDREIETGEAELKEMSTRQGQKIKLSDLEDFLKRLT